MPRKAKIQAAKDEPLPPAQRRPNGTWLPGYSGRQGNDPGRARRDLNFATIGAMREVFDLYGRDAIEKVARTQPAIFLKMLVLLVPRELEITQTTGVKGLSDQQLDDVIAKLEGVLAARAGDLAQVVEATPAAEPVADDPSATKP